MKKHPKQILILLVVLVAYGCGDEGNTLDPETKSLVDVLEQEMVPLSNDPISWQDDDLQFLDPVKDYSVIALGEATHGSAEFFKAKHRILRYLVENHGFKVFAIEADFGESVFINEAVQKSDKSSIEALMKNKMHFWTWRTEEVRDLLYWMCDYNAGKSDDDKVQYMGVDCQFNTYHPDMVRDYLADADVSFFPFADDLLTEVKVATGNSFSGFTKESFDVYLEKIQALKDSLDKYKTDIIDVSSEQKYQLNVRLVEVMKQVSEVRYNTSSTNYRDLYMAENTMWLKDYFDNDKIILWAHNWHVSDYESGGTMGYHLKNDLPDNYYTVGFLFSRGSFTSVTQSGDQYLGVNTQTINTEPKSGSLNNVMSKVNRDDFSVKISDLQKHNEWVTVFLNGIEYFQMGAVYNNKPLDYYSSFRPGYFDRLIYFDRTTASVQLK